MDLTDRVAVITGGARGIGFACAERLLQGGASVSLWDLDGARLARAAAELKPLGAADVRELDLTQEARVSETTAQVVKSLGRIDILINNAGITGGNAHSWELTAEVWRRVIEVNLIAPYLVCRSVVPAMMRQSYGRIVNIASVAGKEGNPNASHYSASKAGLIGFTKSLAKELATQQHPGQLRDAGGGEDRDLCADDTGAHRIHVVEDSDAALRRAPRDRRADLLAGERRMLLFAPARCSTYPAVVPPTEQARRMSDAEHHSRFAPTPCAAAAPTITTRAPRIGSTTTSPRR